MNKNRLLLIPIFILCALMGMLAFSSPALASGSGNASCQSLGSGSGMTSCGNCISDLVYQNISSGGEIIKAIFTAINGVLSKVELSFFNGIVKAASFQQMIYVAVLLYVAIYGIMIMFNLAAYRIAEVASRLVKVVFVLLMTAPGAWTNFNTFIGTPIIGTMNKVIDEFTTTVEGGSAIGFSIAGGGSGSGGSLDTAAFTGMFGSAMTTVFSVQLATAIVAMAKTGFFGWLVAIFLAWALVEFLLLVIGAITTYAKAIIGLSFLFAIAPLFFIFLIFDKTRAVFMGWLSQVMAFMLQPILLFSFLSFYIALINQAVPYLLKDPSKLQTDFCWSKWSEVPGTLWDMYIWAPTSSGQPISGEWIDPKGNVLNTPINIPNVLYFLMLCHLGRSFSKFVETLSNDLAGGIGPGVSRGPEIASMAKKAIGGGIRGARGK